MPYKLLSARTRSALRGDRVWSMLAPVVFLAAGLLFGTSHTVADGTDLRSSSSVDLLALTRRAVADADDLSAQVQSLQRQLDARTSAAAKTDKAVAAAQQASAPLKVPAGLTGMTGDGLIVTLDDADPQTQLDGVDPNQLVVHQSDLQAVVNALWAGGAEAMSIAGQRIIATSAVRCVGNTLLLNGRVYSPPYRVVAIGPVDRMRDRLDASPGAQLFKQAAEYYGLRYSVASSGTLSVPAYDQTVGPKYAQITATPTPTPSK